MTDRMQHRVAPARLRSMLSFRGRIGSRAYFTGLAAEAALLLAALGLHAAAAGRDGGAEAASALATIVSALTAWTHSLLTVKRVRDAGYGTGMAVLFVVTPVVLAGVIAIALRGPLQTAALVAFAAAALLWPGLMRARGPAGTGAD